MRIRLKIAFLFFTAFFFMTENLFATPGLKNIHSWLCFYEENFPKGNIPSYDLYILNSSKHPDLSPIRSRGALAIGYVSLGEINKNDDFFGEIDKSLIINENPNWPGAYRVDMTSDEWQSYAVKKLIPNVLAKGFDGIFIDTIDTAWYLEHEKKMVGAIHNAALFIKKIRKAFPNMIIVLNGGLFMTGEVGNDIDAIMREDVFTSYDFKRKRYKMADAKHSDEAISLLKEFKERFDKPVLTLDYYYPPNKKMNELISKKAKEEGFIPYVSSIDLKTIFFHP